MEKQERIQRSGGMDRRSFLKLSGMLGLGLATSGIVPAGAEAVRFNRSMHKVSKTRLAMGTFVSMSLIHPSRDRAEEAMGLAFEEIDRLTRLMSRFDDATAVGHLNREGILKDVPPEVAQVLEGAVRHYTASRGAFDITVKPVVDLFKACFASGGKTPPSEAALRRALSLVGAEHLELQGRTVRFKRAGMGITLDGIAKGYIVDRASDLLARHGARDHLINAGGDIRTMGSKPGRKPWTVAIQDPEKKRQYPDVIHMTGGAVATSGNYEVYFDRERMFHHIVDPETGLSPELSVSVSVLAEKAMDADALATSVFVMNPDRGTRFINTLPECECLVIDQTGGTFKSSGWRSAAG
jgi:thiamine biosynthesis lipoprotein